MYLKANNKELLLSKSIYFDVPIRDMASISNSKSSLLFQVKFIIFNYISNCFIFTVKQCWKYSCSTS